MFQPPKRLRPHYAILNELVRSNKLQEASDYLYSLPTNVYDDILERTYPGGSFETIINQIESLTMVKKTNELFKLRNYDGDDNFIF
jgi:hypothetical protein